MLKQDCDYSSVKEVNPSPVEIDFDVIPLVNDLDQPECFGFEVAYTIIPIDHKAKGGKLTRTVADSLILQLW